MANEGDALFDFVSKEEIRCQFEEDLGELHACMQIRAWKAAIVLIGSLIEGILYYHIESTEAVRNSIPQFAARQIGLSDLLQWARKHQIIDDNLFRLTEPIRDYRNTIHPRVRERLGTTMTQSLVEIGYNILLEVLRSTNAHFRTISRESADFCVQEVVREVLNREPTKADLKVYVPIVEKYGKTQGGEIIRRSLKATQR